MPRDLREVTPDFDNMSYEEIKGYISNVREDRKISKGGVTVREHRKEKKQETKKKKVDKLIDEMSDAEIEALHERLRALGVDT